VTNASGIAVNTAANASAVAQGMGMNTGLLATAAPAAAAPLATTAGTAVAAAAPAAGGGLLGSGGIGPLIQGAGTIISGFAAGKAAEASTKAQERAYRDEYDRAAYNYGYRNIYDNKKSNIPTSQEQVFAMNDPAFLSPHSSNPGGLLRRTAPISPTPAYQYQIVNGQVVPVPMAYG
jgi:hypothetical protein